jgi:N-acetylmuramoyl-L-alanine amidase
VFATIYPGAVWYGGRNAGYASGTTSMANIKLHYTVGVDSTGIGIDGYFQFLIDKDGTVKQFAELNALCWDSGEWNPTGPGIEIERLGDWEPLTPQQVASCGALVKWIAAEWGIWLAFYDTWGDNGARVPVGGSPTPYLTHRSLIQSSQHVDYVTYDDWAAMLAEPDTNGGFLLALSDEQQWFIYNVLHSVWAGTNPQAPDAGKPGGPPLIPPGPWADDWEAAKKVLAGTGTLEGLSESDVRRIIREELDRTGLTGPPAAEPSRRRFRS